MATVAGHIHTILEYTLGVASSAGRLAARRRGAARPRPAGARGGTAPRAAPARAPGLSPACPAPAGSVPSRRSPAGK